jgi:hypothetical protein
MTETTTTTTTTDTTAQLTPADAAAKLATLTEDKAWGARLFNGDVATRREFDSLTAMAATAGGRLDAVLTGAEPPSIEMTDEDHPMTSRDMATVVGWLREDGVSDATIRQIAEGQPVSKEEHRIAEQALSRCIGDKEWTKKLMGGDVGTLRDHRLLLAIINSPVND